jgi:hypothetical protein
MHGYEKSKIAEESSRRTPSYTYEIMTTNLFIQSRDIVYVLLPLLYKSIGWMITSHDKTLREILL